MRGQNSIDTLNVRTARWVTKVPWHGGNSGQHAVVHRQTDLFPGPPRVLFVKTVERPLFPSTIKITTRLFNLNFPDRIIYGQLVVLFPRNLEIPRIFRSIGHTISPNAQGPVVRKPINVNPRLKINGRFSARSLKLFFNSNFKPVVKNSQRQN